MHLPTLHGSGVCLRPVRRSDIPAIVSGANDPAVSKFMPGIPYPYSSENARRWVNHCQRSARQDVACQFGIERPGRTGILGMIGLNNINRDDSNAEVEYWLGSRHWGTGLASEAMALILEFAFGELELHRVYAVTICLNERSNALLQRHGFVREGKWRKAARTEGQWHDVYAYGLLAEEYRHETIRADTWE